LSLAAKAHIDALFAEDMLEQGDSRAVELRQGDDVGSGFDEIGDGVMDRGHSGADAQRIASQLEGRHAMLQNSSRGVSQPAVDVARHFEVEERRAVVRAIEFVSNRLVDRNRDRFRRRVRIVTGMDRDGLVAHDCEPPAGQSPRADCSFRRSPHTECRGN
jgi:hypothetical protein